MLSPAYWYGLAQRFLNRDWLRAIQRSTDSEIGKRPYREQGENNRHTFRHHSITENALPSLLNPGRRGFHGIVRERTLPCRFH